MSKAKHTPGPWHTGAMPWNQHYIFGPEESGRMRMEEKGTTLYPVAIASQIGDETDEANARLITASPDLLSCLKDIVFFCEEFNPKETMRELWEDATRAIAKAEGK